MTIEGEYDRLHPDYEQYRAHKIDRGKPAENTAPIAAQAAVSNNITSEKEGHHDSSSFIR